MSPKYPPLYIETGTERKSFPNYRHVEHSPVAAILRRQDGNSMSNPRPSVSSAVTDSTPNNQAGLLQGITAIS